jgi:hypothetical protein
MGLTAVLAQHFDVGIALEEVNYGMCPGDNGRSLPYAYVGPWTPREGAFWNAPFGAVRAADQLSDADAVAAFFCRGARRRALTTGLLGPSVDEMQLRRRERHVEPRAPDAHAGQRSKVHVLRDRVVRAANVALEVAEVDVMAVVEHPPPGGSLHDRGVGQPHLEERAVARPEVLQAQDAGSVREAQERDRSAAVVLVADERAAGEHNQFGPGGAQTRVTML